MDQVDLLEVTDVEIHVHSYFKLNILSKAGVSQIGQVQYLEGDNPIMAVILTESFNPPFYL